MYGGRRFRLSAAARSDLREITGYFGRQAPGLDTRFMALFVESVNSIVDRPFRFLFCIVMYADRSFVLSHTAYSIGLSKMTSTSLQ